MDVHQAANLMAQQQIRSLPVVKNGQVVGMVALGDLAVQNQFANEAGEALQSISTPSAPQQLQSLFKGHIFYKASSKFFPNSRLFISYFFIHLVTTAARMAG